MSGITERIQLFNKDFLPEMVKLKYKAMLMNPFRFFRGTCHLFYEDLNRVENFPESPATWLCGDLHLENFGSFKGNNRMEYFDLNDFDESILGPALWEIARVLTSIYVALDLLEVRKKSIRKMGGLFLKKYIETLKSGKAKYIDPRTANGLIKSLLKSASQVNEKILLSKMAIPKEGQYFIRINNLTHFKIEKKLKKELILLIKKWLKNTADWPNNYKVVDAAFRVAGTGSVGLKRYMFLLQSKINKNNFLFIEMKLGNQSSLAPYIKIPQPGWTSEAARVIGIKSRMQNVSPALLSTLSFKGQDYVVQELQPSADKINFEIMPGNETDVERVLLNMATLTASAQIRSGGIQGSAINDELTAFARQADWTEFLLDYANKYAKQVKKDFAAFTSDIKKKALTTL